MGSGNRKRKTNRGNGRNKRRNASHLASISEEGSLMSDTSSISSINNGDILHNGSNGFHRFPKRVSFPTPNHSGTPRTKWRVFIWFILIIVTITVTILELNLTLRSFCNWDESTGNYLIINEDARSCDSQIYSNIEESDEEIASLKNKPSTPSTSLLKSTIHTIIDKVGNGHNDNTDDHSQVDDMFCRGSYEIMSILSQIIPDVIPINKVIPSTSIINECESLSTMDDNHYEKRTKKDHKNKRLARVLNRIDLFLGAGKSYSNLFFPSPTTKTTTVTKRQQHPNESSQPKIESTPKDKNHNEFDWAADVSSPLGFTHTPSQKQIALTVSNLFQDRVLAQQLKNTDSSNITNSHDDKNSFSKRISKVSFGGKEELLSSVWWEEGKIVNGRDTNGGMRLLNCFLKIMKWPQDLKTNFPFNYCSDGCTADFALAHTLEFREKFRPWLITPSVQKENSNGWMYIHGYSPTRYHEDAERGGYSIIWFRPGLHKIDNAEAFIRTIIHTIDKCLADVLSRTDSQVGKCNVVLDAQGFGPTYIPPIKATKKLLKMLQDHFPDTMGVLVLINMGRASQMFMSIVNPFLPDIVKRKIHIVPNDNDKRREMLSQLIDEKFIPTWLGGTDNYQFESTEYYQQGRYKSDFCTNEEGLDYIETMPYHA